jgi:hypothetical protein
MEGRVSAIRHQKSCEHKSNSPSGLCDRLGEVALTDTGPTASAINAGTAGTLGYQIKQESSVIPSQTQGFWDYCQ